MIVYVASNSTDQEWHHYIMTHQIIYVSKSAGNWVVLIDGVDKFRLIRGKKSIVKISFPRFPSRGRKVGHGKLAYFDYSLFSYISQHLSTPSITIWVFKALLTAHILFLATELLKFYRSRSVLKHTVNWFKTIVNTYNVYCICIVKEQSDDEQLLTV